MNKKTIIAISLLVILSIAIGYMIIARVLFNMFRTRETLYVNPQTSVGAVGQSFAVNISVSDVTNLYGWRIKLGWNATLLNATEVTEGSLLKNHGDTFFAPTINNTLGFVLVDCALLGDVPGVNGSGTLATIHFYVKESGDCVLDLYDTSLIDSSVQPITHIVIDGRFNSIS